MSKNIFFFFLFACSIHLANAQLKQHPFVLVSADELSGIRPRINNEPYLSMFERLKQNEQELSPGIDDIYQHIHLIRLRTFIYALNEDVQMAQNCFNLIEEISQDSVYVQNPFSFGLTRAAILQDLSLAYDFCYSGWNHDQRVFVADLLYQLMLSVNANMGREANYRLESNWMGVRYGSALFAAIALNDTLNQFREKAVTAHIWDTKERLRDHIHASHTADGWFVETLGYQAYDGKFIWPALIAFQNFHRKGAIQLDEFAPRILPAFRQHITGTVAIPSSGGVGVKPDLANDNVMAGFKQWPMWMRLVDPTHHAHLKWMNDYIYQGDFFRRADDFFYSILFSDPSVETINPSSAGFLNYVEETVGVLMFRNQFKDSSDIVATFNTSATRFPGHSGPDNLTFRITGLGNIWAVGVGRTGDPTGQTLLFPEKNKIEVPRPIPAGNLDGFKFSGGDGSGYAIGSGSCVGVNNHSRIFMADYTVKSGAKAVFVVKDQSDDGRIWRMHTPGFNKVVKTDDGVLITAPNGSTMRITVPGIKHPVIHIGNVRYGGETIRHNPGVGFHGESYFDNILIDIECDKNILVVMTLQEPGKSHPEISVNRRGNKIKAGNSLVRIPAFPKKITPKSPRGDFLGQCKFDDSFI
jgi:hypothetical protein